MKKEIAEFLDKFWSFIWKLTYSFMSWAFPDSEIDTPLEKE